MTDMTPGDERRALARARFSSFLSYDPPAWSSFLLERLVDEVGDGDAVLSGFCDALQDRPLTRVVANLIQDVSRLLLVRRLGGPRRWLVERLFAAPGEGVALLAAWTVPVDTWLDGEPEECLHLLLGTVFHDEALLLLLDGEPVGH